MATANEQTAQLEQARRIVLADPAHYPDIVTGILPIIASHCTIEAQRWGAAFLAETFASPIVNGSTKEKMCLEVLPRLKDWLDNQADEPILRNAIQTSASVYQYVFRHVTHNPTAFAVWDNMTAIRSNILKRWDNSPLGIRICCIKFVQRVVQVQTPGIIADPRRPDQNEISSALVPRDHPIVPLPTLEAEASGLLDRLLSVFQEPSSDVGTIDATVNCLAILVRTRQIIANKIVSAVLNFNPFKAAQPPLSTKDKVHIKSLERTIRIFLGNLLRRNENNQFTTRIRQYVDRNIALRVELEGGTSKKRGPPEPIDGLDDAKRQRLGAQLESRPAVPPLPSGPLTLAQVFTLTSDQTSAFDAKALPTRLVQQISVALLMRIDTLQLSNAINAVRSRLLELDRRAPLLQAPVQGATTGAGVAEEDDEYEPEFEPVEDLLQVATALDAAPAADTQQADEVAEVSLGPFKLPQPPPVTREEAEQLAKNSIGRVFSMIEHVDQPAKPSKAGLNRLAGSHFDDDAWISLITRLATRAPSNLKNRGDGFESNDPDDIFEGGMSENSLGDGIRETLFKYVITDFRHRLSIAISWLNEEWYNEKVLERSSRGSTSSTMGGTYEKWALRVLESISPYLDAKDKSLIRFLSEIPELSDAMFKRVKNVANDPDRVSLAVNALHYLVLFRPPVKQQALDALEDLYHNYQGANVYAKKVLVKFRPHVLEQPVQNGTAGQESKIPGTATNGDGVAQPLGDIGPLAFTKNPGSNADASQAVAAAV